MPAPTEDSLALPVAAVGPGVSVDGADWRDDRADVSVVVMVMILRMLRSREGCETECRGSRKRREG
jgi:hypothetical protein